MGVKERRAKQKGQLRQQIMDAARDILVREGYDGLSMRKVAERIDYSPTAIYLHFKDRDDLDLLRCARSSLGGLVQRARVAGRPRRHADPLVALHRGTAALRRVRA